MSGNKKLFVEPDVSELQMAAQWRRLRNDLHFTRRHRYARWWVPALSSVALGVGLLVWNVARDKNDQKQVVVDTGAYANATGPGRTITLPDGSAVHIGADAVFGVLNATVQGVATRLERGTANFHVVKRHQGAFSVEAGDITVVVVGTKFDVAIAQDEPHTVTVSVSEGIVRVQRPNAAPIDLGAGEVWSSSRHVEVQQPATEVVRAVPRHVAPAPKIVRTVSVAQGKLKPPEDLFAIANSARLSGDLDAAAQNFDRFRLENPRDPRAAVAAFEAGRIRLDVFADANKAASLLQSALDLNPPAALREDIEARLVQALAAAGRNPECMRQRALYLARHARGRHAADIEKLCVKP